MGGLFGGAKQKSSTTQNQSWGPTGYISDAYKGLVGQAQQTAQTPWNSATQQNVAGFTAPQQQGFSTVQQTVGDYQPYLSDAGALADRGSAAITGADISNYMNPYTDQVIGSAINDWDLMSDRRMADVNSNASKMGALTGDRSQVAQALAREASDREMSSGIASLRNQGWQSALGAAQTDASRALQGSQIQSGLGSLAQQLGFNDANALLGIGGMQQDQKQKVLDANTANAKAQSAYPFETQQWLASILQGVGSQAGGTSTGTGSSTSKTSGGGLGKLIGLGATLFGMPGMADGGVVTGEPQNTSYVPISNMRPTASMQPPQMSVPAASSGGSSGMGEMLEGLKMAKEAIGGTGGLGAMMRTTTDPSSGWSTTVNPSSASGWGNYLSSGLGGLASGIGSAFGFADGGVVEEQPSGLGAIRPTASASPPAEKGWGSMWGNGLSDDANQAIFLSGLGMIAGGGRDAFEDIGRGGLAGANFYAQAQRQRKADAEAKAKEAQGKMMEINGRVIRLMPDGTHSVVYEAPPQRKYERVGNQIIAIDPEANKVEPIYTAPADVTNKPADLVTWEAYQRMSPEEQAKFSEMKRGQTTTEKALSKADSARVDRYAIESDNAEELVGNLKRLEAARSKTDLEGPIGGYASGWTSAGQEVASAAEEVRLGFVGKTKGAVSDAEMRIFGLATPGIYMRDAAAAPVIDGMKLASRRVQEKALFFDEWLRSKGSLDGAQRSWNKFITEKPIIEEAKDGTFVTKPENVDAWRDYFQAPDGASGTAPKSGSAPVRAKDDKGNVIEFNGKEWVPVQ